MPNNLELRIPYLKHKCQTESFLPSVPSFKTVYKIKIRTKIVFSECPTYEQSHNVHFTLSFTAVYKVNQALLEASKAKAGTVERSGQIGLWGDIYLAKNYTSQQEIT